MILYMEKGRHGLIPSKCSVDDYMRMKKAGYRVEVKRSRNLAFHKKFFALCTLIFDNQTHYKKIGHLVQFFKKASGHYEIFYDHEGKEHYEIRSIAFNKMDDLEFQKFYDDCVDIAIEITGVDGAALRDEVARFL